MIRLPARRRRRGPSIVAIDGAERTRSPARVQSLPAINAQGVPRRDNAP
jgi:hypothetical protein